MDCSRLPGHMSEPRCCICDRVLDLTRGHYVYSDGERACLSCALQEIPSDNERVADVE